MNRDRRHHEIQGLLARYRLGAVSPAEAAAVGEHIEVCAACRADLDSYETAPTGHSAELDRLWDRISGTLAGRREDLECFLGEVLAAGAERERPSAPVRVLVAADTEAARVVLASRLGGDDRFAVVGQAAVPSEIISEGVAALPDVIVVKLASTDPAWLDAIGALTTWSPRTRLVAVSGLNARHLAELVTSQPVVDALVSSRPPTAPVAAVPRAGWRAKVTAPSPSPVRGEAPRSIIHEVMRQIGIPVRETS
jgi:hypothetical protein